MFIYQFLRLVTPVPDGSGYYDQYEVGFHCGIIGAGYSKPGSLLGLLLSCRLIYNEVATLVYSHNRFTIRYHATDPDPLRPLRSLATTAIAALTHLTIVLNIASRDQRHLLCSYYWCCLHGPNPLPGLLQRLVPTDKYSDQHQSPLLTRPSMPDHVTDHANHQKNGDELFAARNLVER